MTKSKMALVAGAALAGLLAGAGTTVHASNLLPNSGTRTLIGTLSTPDGQAPATSDKHACKGQNSCKGTGGCKTSDQGCKGKNTCKGKGGCRTDGGTPPSSMSFR